MGTAHRTGSFSTRQACSGKGGESESLLVGWVCDSVASRLHNFIGVEWSGLAWLWLIIVGSVRLVAWHPATLLGVLLCSNGIS